MYAIVKSGGKQYRVSEGDIIYLEKLTADAGETFNLNEVLAVSTEEQMIVGNPMVANASVEVKVLGHGKGKKIIVLKYKAKKNYRRKQGHRQPFTKVSIEKITVS